VAGLGEAVVHADVIRADRDPDPDQDRHDRERHRVRAPHLDPSFRSLPAFTHNGDQEMWRDRERPPEVPSTV
jgi:hypothetical protein